MSHHAPKIESSMLRTLALRSRSRNNLGWAENVMIKLVMLQFCLALALAANENVGEKKYVKMESFKWTWLIFGVPLAYALFKWFKHNWEFPDTKRWCAVLVFFTFSMMLMLGNLAPGAVAGYSLGILAGGNIASRAYNCCKNNTGAKINERGWWEILKMVGLIIMMIGCFVGGSQNAGWTIGLYFFTMVAFIYAAVDNSASFEKRDSGLKHFSNLLGFGIHHDRTERKPTKAKMNANSSEQSVVVRDSTQIAEGIKTLDINLVSRKIVEKNSENEVRRRLSSHIEERLAAMLA